ncbi:unnamed protein product [Cuscuta campestris]|uniref:Uncharacterized protein n=1 Tax=Cuscuta campestris TaxID=132261 RepID=A0A484L270_9ASTE|nr:unnamed protein product [Cuscuta campestris]
MDAPGGAAAVITVEYLETARSRDLLSKFPDNSAFDFDYSQSAIWSPLVPRHLIPVSGGRNLGSGPRRELAYEEAAVNFREATANFRRKLLDSVICNVDYRRAMRKRKKMMKKDFDFSPIGSSSKLAAASTPRKGWAKVLKAAAKHFKKSKNKPQIK